ncbi:MAG: hypothetical protein QNJ31_05945 [Candidatus Caenarcaniphilales bacterium]|nr:hypothetical protein [Candidatus Caenarcaniphilales bacterium]
MGDSINGAGTSLKRAFTNNNLRNTTKELKDFNVFRPSTEELFRLVESGSLTKKTAYYLLSRLKKSTGLQEDTFSTNTFGTSSKLKTFKSSKTEVSTKLSTIYRVIDDIVSFAKLNPQMAKQIEKAVLEGGAAGLYQKFPDKTPSQKLPLSKALKETIENWKTKNWTVSKGYEQLQKSVLNNDLYKKIQLPIKNTENIFYLTDKKITNEQSDFIEKISGNSYYVQLLQLISKETDVPIFLSSDFNSELALGLNGLSSYGFMLIENAYLSLGELDDVVLNELSEMLAQLIEVKGNYYPVATTKEFQIASLAIDSTTISNGRLSSPLERVTTLNDYLDNKYYQESYSNHVIGGKSSRLQTKEEAEWAAKLLIESKPYAESILSLGKDIKIATIELPDGTFNLRFELVDNATNKKWKRK